MPLVLAVVVALVPVLPSYELAGLVVAEYPPVNGFVFAVGRRVSVAIDHAGIDMLSVTMNR